MSKPSSGNPFGKRNGHLEKVPLSKMRIATLAQRDLNPGWSAQIAADFTPEEFGRPTVNRRGGWYYVIDGQHRVDALRQLGYDDIEVDCWVYDGLTEEQEALKFLLLNNRLTVAAFPKYRIGVQAGRPEETAIDDIVRSVGLHVALDKSEGAVSAVGTLRRVYRRDGGEVLGRALAIISLAYGTPGLSATVIDGLGMWCARYGDKIDMEYACEKLAGIRGGVNGLLGRADQIHRRSGNRKGHCVAAAATAVYNSGKAPHRLPVWWKGDTEG